MWNPAWWKGNFFYEIQEDNYQCLTAVNLSFYLFGGRLHTRLPKPYSWILGQPGFKELVSPIKSTIHRTSVTFWILTQNQSLGTCPFRTRETWLDFGVTQKIFCIWLKPSAARRLQFSPSIIMVQMEMMPLQRQNSFGGTHFPLAWYLRKE